MRPQGSALELEARRRRAIAYLQKGRGIREVGRLVGASPSSVVRWSLMYKRAGKEGLRAKPHPGRGLKLGKQSRQRLVKMLLKGPLAYNYRTELWTLKRVAEVIWKKFGVRYHIGHVWYILRGLRWSCQKPESRAREQNERAINNWRARRWPHIKKVPTRRPEHCLY